MEVLGKVGFPFQLVSKTMGIVRNDKFHMHAMMQRMQSKSGKNLRIFHYQSGAVTTLPPLQESRLEILALSEKGGVFLTKASFSLPCGFFLGMVRPLDFEELDGPVRVFLSASSKIWIGCSR